MLRIIFILPISSNSMPYALKSGSDHSFCPKTELFLQEKDQSGLHAINHSEIMLNEDIKKRR